MRRPSRGPGRSAALLLVILLLAPSLAAVGAGPGPSTTFAESSPARSPAAAAAAVSRGGSGLHAPLARAPPSVDSREIPATWITTPDHPVLDTGANNTFSARGVRSPCVLRDGDIFRMWYVGEDSAGTGTVGVATSADGITWVRSSALPVLTQGGTGEWDGGTITSVSVLRDGALYKMWYAASSASLTDSQIGYATSVDGLVWAKAGALPVLTPSPGSWDDVRVGGPSVVRIPGGFVMYYAGGVPTLRIGLAYSFDGIAWTKISTFPLVVPGNPGAWDSLEVADPAILVDDDTVQMFYSGFDSTAWRIGAAVTKYGFDWPAGGGRLLLSNGTVGAWDSAGIGRASVLREGTTVHLWYTGWDATTSRIGHARAEVVPDRRFVDTERNDFDHGFRFLTDVASSPGNVTLSATTDQWRKPQTWPVLTRTVAGPDSVAVGKPAVVKSGSTYHLYYAGYDGVTTTILHATSSNGTDWDRGAGTPIIPVGTGSAWDINHDSPWVVQNGTSWHLWFTGSHFDAGNATTEYFIGHATSSDGAIWAKDAAPVFVGGGNGTWDRWLLPGLAVIPIGSPPTEFRMYYSAYGNGTPARIGLATSTDDGVTWARSGAAPVLPNGAPGAWDSSSVTEPSVLWDGGVFHLWYTGFTLPSDARTGHAWSLDGSTWAKAPAAAPVIGGDLGGWDAGGIDSPAVIRDGLSYTMWYAGGSGLDTGFAYALSNFTIFGVFSSRVFDSGSAGSTWDRFWYNGTAPGVTALAIHLRGGDTPIPDGTWADTPDLVSGSAIPLPRSRYLQYIADFVTLNTSRTPVLADVTVAYRINGRDAPVPGPPDGIGWSADPAPEFTWAIPDPDSDSSTAARVQVAESRDAEFAAPLVDQLLVPNSTGTWRPSIPFADGNLSWRVQSRDSFGLWSDFSPAGTLMIDTVPPRNPDIRPLSHVPGVWSNQSLVGVWLENASDEGSLPHSVGWAFDDSNSTLPPAAVMGSFNGQLNVTADRSGSWYLHVRADDNAGNWNATAAHAGPFLIDLYAPKVWNLVVGDGSGSTEVPDVAVQFEASDSQSGVRAARVSIDGGRGVTTTGWIDLKGPGPIFTLNVKLPDLPGIDVVTVEVQDQVGWISAGTNASIAYMPIIILPPANLPPEFERIDDRNATEGQIFTLVVNARDPESPLVDYSLGSGVGDMTVDRLTGVITWTPRWSEGGYHNITVLATDPLDATGNATFRIYARSYPRISLISPDEGEDLIGPDISTSGFVQTRGSSVRNATVGFDGMPPKVLKVDPDTGSWSEVLSAEGFPSGPYVIVVRATAANGLSNTTKVNVTIVAIPDYGGGGNIAGACAALALLALVAIVIIVVVVVRRSRRKGTGAPPPAPIGAPTRITAPWDGSPGMAAGPAVPPAPPAPTPAPFDVEGAYLVYHDGRLIHHEGGGTGESSDKDIIAGMLTAIQSFIGDTLDRGGKRDVGSIEYGEKRIHIVRGAHLFLAIVIVGEAPADLRERMTNAVEKVEGMHAGVIEKWTGDTTQLAGAGALLQPLLLELRAQAAAANAGRRTATGMSLKSGLEFYQGYVRLKVGIRNEGETTVNDASFKLTYDRRCLRLARVEPDYEREGAEILIGHVEPGQKRSIAFYLDPVICTETPVDGTILYKDFKGVLQSQHMKRRVVDIVCPLFYTEQTVNAAMLQVLVQTLKYRDSRLYKWPAGLELEPVEQVAQAAIQAHAVKFVRRFAHGQGIPGQALIELWFYGRVQSSSEEMAIRATVREDHRTLEVFVASDNLTTLTGLLAELGHNLTEQVKQRAPATKLERAPESEEEAAEKALSLLESAEKAALETEQVEPRPPPAGPAP